MGEKCKGKGEEKVEESECAKTEGERSRIERKCVREMWKQFGEIGKWEPKEV